MALFQSSVLKDHLRLQELQKVDASYQDSHFKQVIKHDLQKKAVTSSGVEMPPLTKKDKFEWMELFEENKKKAQELQREIEKTDKEIDRMVYELYGLTEVEVAIVENS